jgi:hypothetical protein
VSDVLAPVEAALVRRFGQQPERASVSFVGVDPIEVLRFEPIPGDRTYVSLGMSRLPMTGAGESTLAADGPRAELVLSLHDPTDEYADLWRQLAVLAAAPAVEGVVYAPGITVDLGMPVTPSSRCTGVVVTDWAHPSIDTDDGPVDLLQVVPATPNELAWCRVRGSGALLERWATVGVDLLDLTREAVPIG